MQKAKAAERALSSEVHRRDVSFGTLEVVDVHPPKYGIHHKKWADQPVYNKRKIQGTSWCPSELNR